MAVASLAEDVAGPECDPLPSPKDVAAIRRFEGKENLEVVFGDLTDYAAVERCVRGVDVVLHVDAVVSPFADEHPELAHRVNVGSIRNIIRAVRSPTKPLRDHGVHPRGSQGRHRRVLRLPGRVGGNRRLVDVLAARPDRAPSLLYRSCDESKHASEWTALDYLEAAG